jgi:OmpA-OmpF porin, OOP family
MRKFTFLMIFILAGMLSFSQNKVLQYSFENTLAEKKGLGPALQMLDSAGSYVLDTLNEINHKTKTVYRFKKNCGIQFNNTLAGNFLGQTYSIEIYFVFDELGSWKRVLDWKNRTTDAGAYIYDGKLNFYPYVYSDTAFVTVGEYTYYVITRDSATMTVNMFTDTKLGATFTDVSSDAVLDTANVLNLFRDDTHVPNEASSGAVALLNIYNYVLDSNAIKTNFNNLQGQIFSTRDMKRQASLKAYPNPATDKIVIDLKSLNSSGSVLVSLVDLTGGTVYSNRFNAGSTVTLDVNSLQLTSGIYLVKAESDTGVNMTKIVIRR